MRTLFFHQARRLTWHVAGWGGVVMLVSVLVATTYPMVVKQAAQLMQLIRGLPPQLTAFIGDPSQFTDPHGYLALRLHSFLPFAMGLYAIVAGSALVAADEEKGFLDLLLAYPVPRLALFFARVAALLIAMSAIALLGWVGLLMALPASGMEVEPLALLAPFVSLVGVMACLSALALLLTNLLPSRRASASLAGAVLVASFFLSALSRLDERLLPFARALPLHHFDSNAQGAGLNLTNVALLWGSTAIMLALAAWRFQTRDIRVAGEGVLLRRRKTS
ncbi:MAG: ABC transporter permease [Deltaproteobacteria bacterium]|nr:ABC transporter permease [Deltaproteobacteria bacterium]